MNETSQAYYTHVAGRSRCLTFSAQVVDMTMNTQAGTSVSMHGDPLVFINTNMLIHGQCSAFSGYMDEPDVVRPSLSL